MRQGGATAVQEVAFTLSNAEAYIDEAVGRGWTWMTSPLSSNASSPFP